MTAEADAVDTAGVSPRFGAKRLYRDAGSMASSTVANAVLGTVFWAVAASTIPPERLGVMTAVLSVILATSMILATGVGDAYTALLPAVGTARPRLFRHGQRTFGTMAVIAGVGAGVATALLPTAVHGSIAVAVLVAGGTVAWATFILQSAILSSIGRARWLPFVNAAAGVAKIALLPLLAVALAWHSVELAFVIPAAVAIVLLRPRINRIIDSGKDLPQGNAMTDREAIGEFNRFVVRNVASVALSLGILTLAPFMVTAFAGPSQGALFALALSIVQMLDLICAAMGWSLVVHASSTPDEAGKMARSILIKSVLIASVCGILLTALAPVVLRLLNREYGTMGATAVIAVLCVGSLIRTVYLVWSAMQRVHRKLTTLLVFNFISAALFVAIMPSLCHAHGALGGAIAVLIGQTVLSAAAAIHFAIVSRRSRRASRRGALTVESAEPPL